MKPTLDMDAQDLGCTAQVLEAARSIRPLPVALGHWVATHQPLDKAQTAMLGRLVARMNVFEQWRAKVAWLERLVELGRPANNAQMERPRAALEHPYLKVVK